MSEVLGNLMEILCLTYSIIFTSESELRMGILGSNFTYKVYMGIYHDLEISCKT